MAKWWALVVLGAAQFLMVLDAAVMNVSISQLVEDFDTTVTTIQGVITFYALVMAALMVTGGKLGDLWGRRRAFMIGHAIYGVGSLLTALAWSVPALALGWSVLEGIGAALVLPALAALAAGNYQGRDRSLVYGVLGGVSGVGIAVGPILGGWVTTYLTWRIVFLGEVVVVALILLATPRLLKEAPRDGPKPELDWVGSVLSATGLGLIVFGVLRASTWGWLKPHDSPVEPLGFSLTPFVVAGGIALLGIFRSWERRREQQQRDPLIHFRLFAVPSLRAGLQALLAQNLILMGVFFSIPLYLQIVQGFNAFDTGLRMLPISVSLFVSALVGSAVSSRWSARTIVRVGFVVLTVSILLLIGSTEPELDSWDFAVASTILGLGLGLVSSQLGNVVQSAVDEADRSEAGGLQYTAQQLGGSLGTALIGAIVISGLVTAFSNNVASDPNLSAAAQEQVGIQLESSSASFVSTDQVRTAATEAGLSESDVDEVVDSYSDAQLFALRTGLLVAAFISGVSLLATRGLPTRPFSEGPEPDANAAQQDPVAPAEAAGSR